MNSMNMGDVDGDGIDDLVVGASEENILLKDDCGVVYIIYGVSNLRQFYDMSAHINLSIIGANTDDGFGSSLALADVNNDTYNDIIVGSSNIDTVQIFFGGPYFVRNSS